MPKAKRTAKLAHQSRTQVHDELAASKLIMVDGVHRISKNVTGKTDCGKYANGWKYGTIEDVHCKECLGEEAL